MKVRLTEQQFRKVILKEVDPMGTLYKIGKTVMRWLGKETAEQVAKKYGDESIDGLNVFLNKLESSATKNADGRTIYIDELGTPLDEDFLMDAINAVMSGKLKKKDIYEYLPDQLYGGIKFREELFKHLDKILHSQVSKAPIKKFTEEMVDDIVRKLSAGTKKHSGFHYFGNLERLYGGGSMDSGWKFHVFAETIEDSLQLYKSLEGVAKKWGALAKVGGKGGLNKGAQKFGSSDHQWGKQGATIYIPPKVLDAGKQGEMLSDIQNKLANYNKSGKISGDKMLDNKVSYRYEFSKPINSKVGVDRTDYNSLYTSNNPGSKYMVDGMVDIF